jgi:preprotein translocase subunit YajC
VTKGGIHGKIIEVNDSNDTCVIETMAGKVKMERSFISNEMSKQRTTPAKK